MSDPTDIPDRETVSNMMDDLVKLRHRLELAEAVCDASKDMAQYQRPYHSMTPAGGAWNKMVDALTAWKEADHE